MSKALAEPEVVKTITAQGTDVIPTKSPEEFTAFVKSERERYKAVIEAAGVPKM